MKFSNILKAHKKHATNSRSEFLSEMMKVFGSDMGGSVISAFKDNDITRFRKAMGEVIDKLVTIIEKRLKDMKKEG